MSREKIGKFLFWLGVVSVFVMQALTWIQSPVQRVHTAEELEGTWYAIWGPVFWVRNVGGNGLTFALVGVLLLTGKKGSKFWLWGILPGTLLGLAILWEPTQIVPWMFGVGGTVMLLSYFGLLWLWTQNYGSYEGTAKMGRQVQLLGYSFLVSTGLMLCLYFGNPNILALKDLPLSSPQSINLTLSAGMLLLFAGQYIVAKSSD